MWFNIWSCQVSVFYMKQGSDGTPVAAYPTNRNTFQNSLQQMFSEQNRLFSHLYFTLASVADNDIDVSFDHATTTVVLPFLVK